MKKRNLTLVFAVIFLFSFILSACKPSVEKLTVIFDVNAPSNVSIINEPDPVEIVKGTAVSRPTPDPERDLYVFGGWYTTPAATGNPYDFDTPVTENNFTLYAKWDLFVATFAVTFDYRGNGTNSSINVNDGSTITLPVVADLENFYFDGWFIDQTCVTKFNTANAITEKTTLYAGWTAAVRLTVNLNYSGAPANTVIKMRAGTIPQQAEGFVKPQREGFTHSGWYTDTDCTIGFNSEVPLTENKTVFAKWSLRTGNSFVVTFNYNYIGANPATSTQTVEENGIIQPNIPSRDGFAFLGWFTDSAATESFNPSTPITSAIVLYAGWVQTTTLTLHKNYLHNFASGAPDVQTRQLGQQFTKPVAVAPPTSAYKFAGWSLTAGGEILEDSYFAGRLIAGPVVLYAQWDYSNIFEAECVSFANFYSAGWSGQTSGTQAVQSTNFIWGFCNVSDCLNYQSHLVCPQHGVRSPASGGSFVNQLGYPDSQQEVEGFTSTLTFEIFSDRAVTGAEFSWSLSSEIYDITIFSGIAPAGAEEKNGKYTVRVNDVAQPYGSVTIKGATPLGADETNGVRAFTEYRIGNISLNEGKNIIKLITDNEFLSGGIGTARGISPMIDYIKITSYASLHWFPIKNAVNPIPVRPENRIS